MKKLFFLLFTCCALYAAAQDSAYEKEKARYHKKIAKSDADIADAKKGINAKTWVNRAELYLEMYERPVKDLMLGMSQLQVKTILRSDKSAMDSVVLQEKSYDVLRYPAVNLYFSDTGILTFWEITNPIVANPLFTAHEAYLKAYELDEKKKETKKITEGLRTIAEKMRIEAFNSYTLSQSQDALNYFEGAAKSSGHETLNIIDTLAIYNVGYIARTINDIDKALEYYQKSLEIGYEQEGSTIASYAALVREKGDTARSMDILNKGFVKYPKNQEILVSLINGYLVSGKNLSEVLPYIKQGQENEPNNAGLYFAEGVVYQNLNEPDKALPCYLKAIELNPDLFSAQYYIGALYYNKAVDIQNKAAEELDDNKYEKMLGEMDVEFDKALPYLKKAHALMPTERGVVESLRSIYYRYQTKNPEMKAEYEHYLELLKTL